MLFVCVPRRLLVEVTSRSLSQVSAGAGEKPDPPRSALIVGGGIIGISSALQLARRGVKVTVVEENSQVSQGASYRNGAILCQSMAASWACAHLLSENPGEMKSLRLGWRALTDPKFLLWCGWFWYNSLLSSRAQHNHQSCRLLAWLRSTLGTENISGYKSFLLSLKCREEEEREFGDRVEMNKTAVETIKLFHDKREMSDFLSSSQAQFWSERGYEFRSLTVEECRELEPGLAEADTTHGLIDNRGLVGGVLCGPGLDSSGDVHLYTNNIARLATSLGVDIRLGQQVRRVLTEPGGQAVSGVVLSSGEREETLSADVYILATGARTGELAGQVGVAAPVYPLKGHMVTVRVRPGEKMLRRNVYSPRHGLVSPLAPDRLRVAGMVEAVGHDHTREEEKGRTLLGRMAGALEEGLVAEERIEDYHTCLRPVSADDVPLIGRTRLTNLYLNTGHGSKGWTYSWGSAALLAQVSPPPPPHPLLSCESIADHLWRGHAD